MVHVDETMDASMYELSSGSSTLLDAATDRRRHMTLDLAAASQRKCFYAAPSDCKVTSPDLEAFLLYASAAGGGEQDWTDQTTTSTPTQILFPKSVTAEQEAYARGFVDALEELHRRQGVPQSAAVRTQSSTSCAVDSSATGGHWSSSVSSPASSVGGRRRDDVASAVDGGRRRMDQTVPRLACLTPPSSPDVDVVEAARVDRKRERNRLAAQKCRSRKLEQIVVLESRCAVLRADNDALSRSAAQLASQVARLRQTLDEHTAGSHCVITAGSHHQHLAIDTSHRIAVGLSDR